MADRLSQREVKSWDNLLEWLRLYRQTHCCHSHLEPQLHSFTIRVRPCPHWLKHGDEADDAQDADEDEDGDHIDAVVINPGGRSTLPGPHHGMVWGDVLVVCVPCGGDGIGNPVVAWASLAPQLLGYCPAVLRAPNLEGGLTKNVGAHKQVAHNDARRRRAFQQVPASLRSPPPAPPWTPQPQRGAARAWSSAPS